MRSTRAYLDSVQTDDETHNITENREKTWRIREEMADENEGYLRRWKLSAISASELTICPKKNKGKPKTENFLGGGCYIPTTSSTRKKTKLMHRTIHMRVCRLRVILGQAIMTANAISEREVQRITGNRVRGEKG